MVRVLQRCHQLLRGACQSADQGNAFSPSGIRSLQTALQRLRPAGATDDDEVAIAQSAQQFHKQRLSSNGCTGSLPMSLSGLYMTRSDSLGLPWALSQVRGLFGAVKPAPPNPQNHTHDKYKKVHPQPTYDWMKGRFVLDRNGVIWHRQANYRHHRHSKTASQLTRLKRWKPLYKAYAAKLRKIGFKSRYWAPPDPQQVPGAHEEMTGAMVPYSKPTRWSARPDLNQTTGDPALRQSRKPGPRQKIL